MKAERWEEIKRICSEALELDAARREQFLAQACAGDPSLRKEVESLLAQQSAAEEFIETPALEAAARELAAEPVTDLSGHTLLHYQVEEKIGEGGMGVVYRARDTHLGRDVAIKLLPEALSGDRQRMLRFEREAKLLASLNHPNIAAIHSIEKIEDRRFLVLELVEGESLYQRVARGRLPMEEALVICRQIAEGLEAAHEKGIIHRDLKPANIKITPEGKVKILDFGLAKPVADERGAIDRSPSPPITETSIHPGIILGTPGYMSPEQAGGKPADRRTDIWAFGCVLYECLTGKRAFPEETVRESVDSILRSEPDWKMLPADTPWSVRCVLKRCLKKDPSLRLHDIADARIELSEPIPEPPMMAPRRSSGLVVWGGYALAVLAVAALGFIVLWWGSDPPAAPPAAVHTLLPPPDGYAFGSAAVSPDGTQLVAVVFDSSGRGKLWLRSLATLTEEFLPDSDNAIMPFWSPDSKSVGFFADKKLKTISVTEGVPKVICDAVAPGGGTWNAEGTILFCPEALSVLRSVAPGQGGLTRVVTRMEQEERCGHLFPRFLQDGRHFIYRACGSGGNIVNAVHLGSLDSPDGRLLLSDAIHPDFGPPDFLLFFRAGTLMAQRFDFERARPLAEPVPLAEQISEPLSLAGRYGLHLRLPGPPAASFSTSRNGVLVYNAGISSDTRLIWRERDGTLLDNPSKPGHYYQVFLSPDETQASLTDELNGVRNLWLWTFDTDTFEPLTFETQNDVLDPIWSPDGRQLVYQLYSGRHTRMMILRLRDRSQKLLLSDGLANYPDDWSPDGKWILGRRNSIEEITPIVLAADGSAGPRVLPYRTHFNIDQFRFSPDGQWVAYNSDESSRQEVWIARFPSMTEKRMVSNAGGCQPIWRKDGKEVFYLSPDAKVMSVVVELGATLQAEAPRMLFQSRVPVRYNTTQYAVGAKGKRFLLIEDENTRDPLESREPLHIVSNWQALLKR